MCKARSASYFPTRILNLRQASLHPDLALIEARSQAFGRYACLSHSWGPSQPLRTMKANLKDIITRIFWSSLPRSFQDAVFVARELSIDYLWMDSLCIIQDDLDDWAAESSTIAGVFSNAYVTISANVADNCYAGFLRERISPESKKIHSRTNTGAAISVHVCPSLLHGAFSDFWYDDYNVRHNPLRQRAWAFQEYILSPRLLQFSPSKILWECNTLVDYECGAYSHDRLVKLGFVKAMNGGEASSTLLHTIRSFSPYEYSHRNLTFNSDPLTALSSLARMAQSMLWCEHYAGLWRAYLIEDLAWCSINPGVRPEIAAPTWSWASVQGSRLWLMPFPTSGFIQKTIDDYNHTIAATVVDVSYTTASSDSTGAVLDGCLKISSIVLDATLGDEAHAKDGHIPCFVKLLDCKADRSYLDVVEEDLPMHAYSCSVLGRSLRGITMLVCRPKSPQDYRLVRAGLVEIYCDHEGFAPYLAKLSSIEPEARRVVEIV